MDRSRYEATREKAPEELRRHVWVAGMTHIALQLQKLHQKEHNNKGRTVLIIDDNKAHVDHLAEVLWAPPTWTDTYYDRARKQEQLDQIIDNAFAVRSHHAGMVQVADLFAFLFRRYAELKDYAAAQEWEGEVDYITNAVSTLARSLTASNIRWTKRTKSPAAGWFNELAPPSLFALP